MKVEDRIKYTDRGFSYVEVTPYENIKWGGFCICNGCNNDFENENMYLVYVLADTYCKECFNEWLERQKEYSQEDVEYDLHIQNGNDIEWYKYHLDR